MEEDTGVNDDPGAIACRWKGARLLQAEDRSSIAARRGRQKLHRVKVVKLTGPGCTRNVDAASASSALGPSEHAMVSSRLTNGSL